MRVRSQTENFRYVSKSLWEKGATKMREDILMLLSLEEIENTIKGLKIALEHINKNKVDIDENMEERITDMLRKLLYVKTEYSNKAD